MASVLQVIGAIERHRQRGGRHHPDRHPPARHPPRAGGRPLERRGGVAPGAGAGGLAPGPPAARRARAAHRHRHAGDGDPPRPRLDHRRRGRGHPRARRRDDPAGLAGRHRAAAGARGRAVLGAARAAGGRHAHRPRPRRRRARRDEEPVRGGGRPRLQRAGARRCRASPPRSARSRTASTTCRTGSSSGCCGPPATISTRRPSRGLLHLSQAAEDLGDQAQQMVWLIEQREELHPILRIALGESDEVVVRVPVAAGLGGRRRPAGRPPARRRPGLPHPGHPPRRPVPLPAPGPGHPRARRRAHRQRPRRGPPDPGRALRLAADRGRGHVTSSELLRDLRLRSLPAECPAGSGS